MSEWISWSDRGWPDWRDVGRMVEVLTEHEWYRGRLNVEDWFFDGEEEIPMFSVELNGGQVLQFPDHEAFRFVD